MQIIYSPLGQAGKSGKFQFEYLLIAGANPEKAQQYAEQFLGKEDKFYVASYETEKLTIRPGEKNKILAELRNPAATAANLTMKTYIVYGLDTEKLISTDSVSLKAGEIRTLEIPLVFPSDAKLGIAIRTEFYDAAGKLVARNMEFCSVTEFSPRDTGFGIINAGQANQHGAQEAWNNIYKKNYDIV